MTAGSSSDGFSRIFLAVQPIVPAGAVLGETLGDRLEQACRAQPLLALKGGKALGKLRAEVQVLGPGALRPRISKTEVGSVLPFSRNAPSGLSSSPSTSRTTDSAARTCVPRCLFRLSNRAAVFAVSPTML